MLHVIALAACVLLCGLGFRIRGGALAGTRAQLPGQVSRLVFCALAALTAWVAGADWRVALALIPAWFIGCVLPLGGWIGLGRTPTLPEWACFPVGAARGALWTMFPAAVLGFAPALLHLSAPPHWAALLPAGAAMPLFYWTGRQSGLRIGRQLTYKDFPTIGEAITGLAWGAATIAAVAI